MKAVLTREHPASRYSGQEGSTHMTNHPRKQIPLGMMFILGSLLGLLSSCGPSMPQEPVPLKIGERTFAMRLACDPASRERGLGGVRELPEDEGMIFAFPQRSVRSFWMKDCFIDLDIVFVDDRSRVVDLGQMKAAPPRTANESLAAYEIRLQAGAARSRNPARFVLEFAAGTIAAIGLSIGDRVEFDAETLKSVAK